MGIEYTLIKNDIPEAFQLGKGPWDTVFGRRFGFPLGPKGEAGNFDDAFVIDEAELCQNLVKAFSHYKSLSQDDLDEYAQKIVLWAAQTPLFLINYWEEIEHYQENRDRKGYKLEFSDVDRRQTVSLFDYKIVQTIWDK